MTLKEQAEKAQEYLTLMKMRKYEAGAMVLHYLCERGAVEMAGGLLAFSANEEIFVSQKLDSIPAGATVIGYQA